MSKLSSQEVIDSLESIFNKKVDKDLAKSLEKFFDGEEEKKQEGVDKVINSILGAEYHNNKKVSKKDMDEAIANLLGEEKELDSENRKRREEHLEDGDIRTEKIKKLTAELLFLMLSNNADELSVELLSNIIGGTYTLSLKRVK